MRMALLPLLATKAYRHGNFTLASGRTSHHYVNCKPVSLSGSGLLCGGFCSGFGSVRGSLCRRAAADWIPLI